jgi:transposase
MLIQERRMEIQILHKQGLSIKEISKRTGYNRIWCLKRIEKCGVPC